MRAHAVFRVRLLTGAAVLLSLVLVARLYHIQVYGHDHYLAEGEQQYVHTVRDLYDRGTIFFTTRDDELVSAATVQSGYVLAVDPTRLGDVDAVYEALTAHLALDQETFRTRATLPERTYVEVAHHLTNGTAAAIEALGLPGVHLYRDQWRFYPGDTLAARTVGFTGFSGSEAGEQPTGRYGLERTYEAVLARDQERLSVNFFAEIFSNLGQLVFDQSDERAGDIVTTLEPRVSRSLQNELLATNEVWGSQLTGGIIMNPQTGAIYALDAVPTFDLNNRQGASIEDFQNPLVENVYELGSIIKALTVAAGLDHGAITPESTYYDAGAIELNTFTIRNFDGRGRGTVDMQEVLNQSLNTGVAHIVEKMGKDNFRRYFRDLKLGSEAGIDLPNEAHGLIENLNSPRDVEYATASFGQGIALTPIAAVRALATLGNGGYLVTPHLARAVRYEDGTERDIRYPQGAQVFSTETSETISRMLVATVDDALRQGTVALPNYTVAAKTGTAQIADAVNGGYYDDRFLHSFFGYFPAYDPQFLIFLYTIEPQGARFASETLTDPFMEMVTFLINYYNVPPDRS
jgi:cell division protein FtsI/penicillin-binding protein 2